MFRTLSFFLGNGVSAHIPEDGAVQNSLVELNSTQELGQVNVPGGPGRSDVNVKTAMLDSRTAPQGKRSQASQSKCNVYLFGREWQCPDPSLNSLILPSRALACRKQVYKFNKFGCYKPLGPRMREHCKRKISKLCTERNFGLNDRCDELQSMGCLPENCFERYVDYHGDDLDILQQGAIKLSEDDCAKTCQWIYACKFWTWLNKSGKCYVKHGQGERREGVTDVISGPKFCATLCEENQYVSSNTCTPCAAGSTREAGDDASGENTECAGGPQYIGCYKDSPFRTLPENIEGSHSKQDCANKCKEKGYEVMGRQYAKECFCGDNDPKQYGKYGKQAASICKCGDGEENQGPWTNCVYLVEASQKTSTTSRRKECNDKCNDITEILHAKCNIERDDLLKKGNKDRKTRQHYYAFCMKRLFLIKDACHTQCE